MFSQVLSEIALYGSPEPSLADRIAAYLERVSSEPFSAQALEKERKHDVNVNLKKKKKQLPAVLLSVKSS